MEYSIKAKPTKYGQTQFRSRLEARWAAMFDLLRWEYIYEPFDLDYWSPDFLILGAYKIFVEVKPILWFDGPVADKMQRNLSRWMKECGVSGCVEPLLLGASPFVDYKGHACMGWCAEIEPDGEFWWDGAVPGIWDKENPLGRYGYCHAWGGYCDRITGGYDGGCHGAGIGEFETAAIALHALWAQAGNLTQWKPGGPQR